MTGVRLEARGVVKRYAGVLAVDGVDLDAVPGEVAAIVGPNGAGKTTLFHCLSGYLLPDTGTVHLGADDVTEASSDARARRGLARTFQHSSVFPSLTVEENLLVGAENRRRNGITLGLLGVPDPGTALAMGRVDRVVAQLRLEPHRHAAAATLPTGRLRLVELGRALCSEPAVLLLDEPASGLDDEETEELHDVLRALADGGLALLLVEHDFAFIRDTADVVHVMVAGRVVASGSPAEIEADAVVRASVFEPTRAAPVTLELTLAGARAGYGPVEALHGVTMAFPSGTLVAVLGRNGAGKSTAMRALAGTVRLRAGVVRWQDRDITGWSAYDRALLGITMVPDESGVFASLTVEENLALFAPSHSLAGALEVFPELEPLMAREAGTLSGGEQQMLALSRAVLRPGRVVVLDEASHGLSPSAVGRLYAALGDLVASGRTVIVVEQYAQEVLAQAGVVYVLRRGDVSFAGEVAELDDATLAAALG